MALLPSQYALETHLLIITYYHNIWSLRFFCSVLCPTLVREGVMFCSLGCSTLWKSSFLIRIQAGNAMILPEALFNFSSFFPLPSHGSVAGSVFDHLKTADWDKDWREDCTV